MSESENSAATACLMGCAVGDSMGLPYENLSSRRIGKLLGASPLKQRLLFGQGMVSDDTEHSLIVARCLNRHPFDPAQFEEALSRELRCWIVGFPAGVGFATLRGILKLCLGIPPNRSGVFSAGNGPAMRSAVIGCLVPDNAELRREFALRSAVLTHTDPKAAYGAVAISEIAARLAGKKWQDRPEIEEVERVLNSVSSNDEWRSVVTKLVATMHGKTGLHTLGGRKGVSGYVYQTVPFAIACWYRHFGDFEKTVEESVRGGGDTDTTAAICGALAGISCFPESIPDDWTEKILYWPMKQSDFSKLDHRGPQLGKVWIRNTLFLIAILAHCIRRCFPPY